MSEPIEKTQVGKEDEDSHFAQIKNLAKEAYRYLDSRQWDKAESKLRELLAKEPANTYGLVGMGDLHFKRKEFKQALEYYNRCIKEDSSNKFSLMGLMNCYREMNLLNRVIEVAEEYRHITITDASILSRVADAHRKLKNFKESEVYYMQALQINPKDQYVIVGLGHLFFACQRYKDAIHWWEKLLVIQPDNIKILTEIGNSYRKIKDFDEAIQYYRRAADLDPRNFFALYGLAESYRGKKDFRKANEFWERILEFDPDNKLIINRYADSLRGMGEYDKALECFNRILSEGEDYFALLGKASSLKLKGSRDKAEEIYLDLHKKFPMDPRPVIELSELYYDVSKKDEAIKILEEFHRKQPLNEEVKAKLDFITQEN
ncbi:tetratricopeptide repeat protein [Leptospira fainei serovar Hurstbridge str. BUT 6]|uniref:Tetratricopeptide repeat protein n=1 Tax=Leptospira fainei serovar Hurstbridge str. BUT 6 TaxID=1193011 RepID=S3UZH7_9LEPT|nr:tetratricopeptide repeat protein [Leptospira fainei serovar Hurstbridge str. BUT 6]